MTSVSSDSHMWNLVFLQLLLEEYGGQVVNLGACTPDELIMSECARIRPDALVISTVNGHGHIDGLRLIRKIRRHPELAPMKVVIGGKLGVHGSRPARFGAELITNGFDAVFEADADFDQFLDCVGLAAPTPQRITSSKTRSI
ncbi:cobalamin B12-binding domain-containing protein [Streptomyces acidiscabies]|uniref:Cobalamin-dependent protein n=1 Tax=Streptomyces acidiscabies TaxID=42234 RepID=A0A0L0K5K3_9ACTN|nr:cobalamin-dependent protein [Streptomyces acidiscabies]KND33111.1 methylmalonyl-CoA mutase [Streptomyces acidiscabies]MDX2960435.1 cobalamin-dependent protein [Streptomyces acidiscabies]MDX3017721.1 cobalamin-dependent protein [Streptomyces acidiscabies]MDX3794350.1 cobalamin-dependent protein [Streptomyces acidiscabies]GAQ50845.1 methylaspartate mutase subunit S [Streptomyces acidiscabies]